MYKILGGEDDVELIKVDSAPADVDISRETIWENLSIGLKLDDVNQLIENSDDLFDLPLIAYKLVNMRDVNHFFNTGYIKEINNAIWHK